MTIDYACPACDARLTADDEMLGQTTFCSACGKPTIVDPGSVPAAPGLDGEDTELKSLLLLLAGIAIAATLLSVGVGAAIAFIQKGDSAVAAPATTPPPAPAITRHTRRSSREAGSGPPRTSLRGLPDAKLQGDVALAEM